MGDFLLITSAPQESLQEWEFKIVVPNSKACVLNEISLDELVHKIT